MRLYQDRFAVVMTDKRWHEATDKGDVIVLNWTDGKPLLVCLVTYFLIFT